MVRKKAGARSKSLAGRFGIKHILENEKANFLLGIVLLFISAYIIIAFFSYFSTGQADQSLVLDLRPGELENQAREFKNYCGSIGALISYFLIARCFGFPALFIPLFLALTSLQLMSAYKVNLWKWFFGTMLVMVWSSVTLAKFLTPFMGDQVFNPGGDHGVYCSQYLENVIGSPGLTAVLIFVALALLTNLS